MISLMALTFMRQPQLVYNVLFLGCVCVYTSDLIVWWIREMLHNCVVEAEASVAGCIQQAYLFKLYFLLRITIVPGITAATAVAAIIIETKFQVKSFTYHFKKIN